MDKNKIVIELTKIKRSMVDRLVDRIQKEKYGLHFLIEEEMNNAYSEIAKLILGED